MDGEKRRLRAIALFDRGFWKDSTEAQFSQIVEDQNADYGKRKLTQNEVSVLALNEVCVKKRRGYFLHLPSRQSWTGKSDQQRVPATRVANLPGSEYPTVLCINFVWTNTGCDAFLSSSQRARYLHSSAVLNPPSSCTPMYAIQWASYWKFPIYRTAVESLVVFQTPTCYYILKLSELATILGYASGDLFMNTSPDLWTASVKQNATGVKKHRFDALAAFRVFDLETLHGRILEMCSNIDHGLPVSFTAAELWAIVPRSSATPTVGSPLGTGHSADPPTRKGEVRRTQPRGTVLDEEEDSA